MTTRFLGRGVESISRSPDQPSEKSPLSSATIGRRFASDAADLGRRRLGASIASEASERRRTLWLEWLDGGRRRVCELSVDAMMLTAVDGGGEVRESEVVASTMTVSGLSTAETTTAGSTTIGATASSGREVTIGAGMRATAGIGLLATRRARWARAATRSALGTAPTSTSSGSVSIVSVPCDLVLTVTCARVNP